MFALYVGIRGKWIALYVGPSADALDAAWQAHFGQTCDADELRITGDWRIADSRYAQTFR
jgi:hypothetical protein